MSCRTARPLEAPIQHNHHVQRVPQVGMAQEEKPDIRQRAAEIQGRGWAHREDLGEILAHRQGGPAHRDVHEQVFIHAQRLRPTLVGGRPQDGSPGIGGR